LSYKIYHNYENVVSLFNIKEAITSKYHLFSNDKKLTFKELGGYLNFSTGFIKSMSNI